MGKKVKLKINEKLAFIKYSRKIDKTINLHKIKNALTRFRSQKKKISISRENENQSNGFFKIHEKQ